MLDEKTDAGRLSGACSQGHPRRRAPRCASLARCDHSLAGDDCAVHILAGISRVLDDMDIDRFQFSPDHQQGLIVQYRFENASDRTRRLRFEWSVKSDLRPGWNSERLGIQDGQDVVDWHPNEGVFIARDIYNTWFCVWGATPSRDARRIEHPHPIRTNGHGVTAASIHAVTIGPQATSMLTFVISGSTNSQSDAVGIYNYLAEHHGALLAGRSVNGCRWKGAQVRRQPHNDTDSFR